jgi:hypothetical protein
MTELNPQWSPQDAAAAPAAPANDIAEPYYCPACGKRVEYRQQCRGGDGKTTYGHAPVEVVSTDEIQNLPDLSGLPAKDDADMAARREALTAAPNTDGI